MNEHKELDSIGGGGRSFQWEDCLAELVETFWALIFGMMVRFFFPYLARQFIAVNPHVHLTPMKSDLQNKFTG